MAVVYMDECRWDDVSDGMIFHFIDPDDNVLAEVALMDSQSNLWKFQVNLPPRNQVDGINPAAIVATQASARRIVETILLSTIVTR
jgi:hypothetical protein